ncbi:Golgi resident protein GCP60 isoform X2 [Anoplophora glabripennis]|uniref:Golgi resident protein GCP60 isoform X2 n=1 Tax=Anoplophora glabripennis TaxID=217634 RepID=UPI0008753665|nr:Golgi resident protein GCP60 isoform X2 [Anoplophora glabripennis]
MATECDVSQVSEKFGNFTIEQGNDKKVNENYVVSENLEYGLPLTEVYKLAFNFYREKEGKAVHFSYEDKLQLVAFSQQVLHGPYTEAIHKLPPLGAFDVVGRDRRLAWQKLGQLSSDQARTGFVELLSRRCPLFSTYIEAHRREKKEKERKAKEEESRKLIEEEEKLKKSEEEKFIQEQLLKEEAIKRQIQQALNEQTYDQFRKYAEQQYPGDPEKQGNLIRQLQDQHYIQYMQQLQAAQRDPETNKNANCDKEKSKPADNSNDTNQEAEESDEPGLVAASMWTRSDIDVFKQSVSQGEGDGVVRVGHGETVTVRVPTHPQGSRLFWEFATDHYDIGFGVYFEFGTPTSEEVSVHVSESDDEDMEDLDEDEIFDDETIRTNDLESGSISINGISKPLLHEIVPVYRRDCQNEVYAGSHPYPGKGVYLLKFDNSYSLWRSKTLYYRVYYTH